MPVTPTYPGVYIEEIPSGVRTIVGVATSITAFVGRTQKGPINHPVRMGSFGDFERVFGGLWVYSPLSFAVRQFFQNGGTDAIVVRVVNSAVVASRSDSLFELQAAWKGVDNPGEWANRMTFEVDTDVLDDGVFNLTVRLRASSDLASDVIATETFRNVSTDPASPRYVVPILEQQSYFAQIGDASTLPPANTFTPGSTTVAEGFLTGGTDGGLIDNTIVLGSQSLKTGIYALEDVDLFNLLYIPPLSEGERPDPTSTLGPALAYCRSRRAMLIVDPPTLWNDVAAAESGFSDLRSQMGGAGMGINAMAYFPDLRMPNPLKENRLETFPPGGAMAGLIARTDANRGVWKAPAGIEASLVGVSQMALNMTDGENGRLNPIGLNCLRSISPFGFVSWGARTVSGGDQLASEWKYIPVRRTALYIEESLYRGLHWAVFEPNDESLWAQIRLNVGSFMQNLFRKGAFQGTSAKEAYLVKCDAETNPQNSIDQGIVTVYVGFAPLKPAEFVIVQIQQLAGQLEV